MLAGNETSSTALTWILYLLSLHTDAQDKLRAEMIDLNDRLTMCVCRSSRADYRDELNALPYLDAVVREGLRLLPPAPSTIREAVRDVIVPLGQPITDRNGKTHTSVKLARGSTLFIRE